MEQAIDADTLQELRSLMGDALNEVLLTYVEVMPTQIEELGRAISLNDADSVFNIAHKMKSSSGSVGATGIANKAEEIELIGRAGGTEGTAVLLEHIRDMFVEADQVLREELRG